VDEDPILSDLRSVTAQKIPADSGDPILNDLRGIALGHAPEAPAQTYKNQPFVGLIKGVSHPNPQAELASLQASVPNVPQAPVPQPAWRTAVENAVAAGNQDKTGGVGSLVRGAGEAVTQSVLPMPGAIVGGAGSFIKNLGSPEELNVPSLQTVGGALQRAGEAITPGDWFKPTTALGRLPATAGSGIQSVLDVAGKGYQGVAELAGFPRVGATAANVVSNLPLLAGGAEAATTIAREGLPAITRNRPAALPAGMVETPGAGPTTPMPPKAIAGGGAATVSANPYPELSNATYPKQGTEFPLLKPSMVAGDVSEGEQAVRAQILRDVGITDSMRDSSVTGNPQTLWEEVTAKNTNTPEGQVVRANMANEQAAVRGFGDQLVERTGANPRADPETSGALIADPLWKAKELVRQNASAMYDEARSRIGSNPLQTQYMQSTLSAPSFRNSLLANNEGTLRAVDNMYNTFQREGFGPTAPAGTVQAAEAFRQFLTGIDTFQNHYAISALQEALDHDVAAAGGGDLLANARANWKTYKENFADPTGISSLLTDPNDVNRQVPYERVGQRFLNMPNAQAAHIWTQLDGIKNIPGATPELVQAAEQAKAELKGAAIREITQAAGKTASINGVAANQAATALQGKLHIVLADDPELLRGVHSFNQASQLIPDNTMYRGAEAQRVTVAQQAMTKGAPFVGGLAGGAIGSLAGQPLIGAGVGTELGAKAGAKLGKSFAESTARQTAERYQRNAQIGIKAP
jgi:hypothetical protein